MKISTGLLLTHIHRIIADPSPQNLKIIKLLKKIGFDSLGEIETPDGAALLMELTHF
jgi:RimJ/RimL family protein N-acetyltransferase